MATSTGSNAEYASLMPLLSEDADIQVALQTYHYGAGSPLAGSITPNFTDENGGIAGKLKWIRDQIDSLTASKISLSTVTTSGDLLVGSGASAVTRLGIGSSGHVLRVSGGGTVGWESLDNSYLPKSGGTLSGTLRTEYAGATTSTVSSSGDASSYINAPSGATKSLFLGTGTTLSSSKRWGLSVYGAESGDRTGGGFKLSSYNNSGLAEYPVIEIDRDNVAPVVNVYGDLSAAEGTFSGNVTVLSPTSGLVSAARNISFGTGTPSGGADGDIYIQIAL